jgi:hypothetical protein
MLGAYKEKSGGLYRLEQQQSAAIAVLRKNTVDISEPTILKNC